MGNNVVVIGTGIAGMSAAKTAAEEGANVTLIGEEAFPTYIRTRICELLPDELQLEEIFVNQEEWYKVNNINLIVDKKVVKIDSKIKEISLEDESIAYDRLIICTGAKSFIPPMNGCEKKGVFTLRNAEDINNIKKYILDSKKAVIVGGGILGFEAAWNLKKAGLNVTIVEKENRVLIKQLNPKGSSIIEAHINKMGIVVYTDETVEKILGDNKVEQIKLHSGKIINADIIIISAGVRSDISLAKEIGLHTNLGILTDVKMRTSDKYIYAAGDCAECDGCWYGLYMPAMQQGKIAGYNALNDKKEEQLKEYKNEIKPYLVKTMGVSIASFGNINEQTEEYCDYESNDYKCVFKKDGTKVGIVMIGNTKNFFKEIRDIK